jgi:hypothetical protein
MVLCHLFRHRLEKGGMYEGLMKIPTTGISGLRLLSFPP